jgi:hypothetical protein
MADVNTTTTLRDAETKLVALMSEKQVWLSEKQSLEAEKAGLVLQLSEKTGRVAALESEIKTLRDDAAKRQENDETAAVELAFATYKDSHKLSDAHKKQMLITLRNDPKLFSEIYPVVQPDQRHLMRNVSQRQSPAPLQHRAIPQGNAGRTVFMSDVNARVKELRAKGMPLDEAVAKATSEAMQPGVQT